VDAQPARFEAIRTPREAPTIRDVGHESIATTNLYLHFLGTGAHRAGLERLNLPRGPCEHPLGGLHP